MYQGQDKRSKGFLPMGREPILVSAFMTGYIMADPIKLAYFMAVKEGASYLGGLLLTDTSGIPWISATPSPSRPRGCRRALRQGPGTAPQGGGHPEDPPQGAQGRRRTCSSCSATELAGGWTGDAEVPGAGRAEDPGAAPGQGGETSGPGPGSCCSRLAEGAAPLRVMFAPSVDAGAQERPW